MQDQVARWPLVAYALPSAPVSMLMMMLVVYLAPFYSAQLGLDLAAVGAIFFFARMWDAVIDPLVGNLSDLTRSRFGRRKPWIAAGTPLLLVCVYLFFQPPAGVGTTYLAVVAVAFYAAITVVQIPYLSWGAELSRDYVQRIRINGYREAGTMIGIILVAMIPVFLFRGMDPTMDDIVRVFTYIVLILLPLSIVPALMFAPKTKPIDTEKLTLFRALNALRANRPFMRLLVASLLIWVGGHIYNSTSLFLMKDALQFSPGDFLWFLAIQYVVGIALLPVIIRIGARIGKHRALIFVGMAFFLILPLYLFVEPGNITQVVVVYALKGTVTAAIWVLPPAMVADSVEHGLLEGIGDDVALYMSLYFLIQKMAAAIGVGVALPVAAWLGYDPQAVDAATSFAGIKFVAVILPGIIAAPAILLLFNYPIDERRHAEIREELHRKGIETA
ncbi:MAG: MFS transporter [Gammaproteobacteria bacterium]|nr:MFS transporter [Gammaproteobacteria bacterium]